MGRAGQAQCDGLLLEFNLVETQSSQETLDKPARRMRPYAAGGLKLVPNAPSSPDDDQSSSYVSFYVFDKPDESG
jgi:hypothetical protein